MGCCLKIPKVGRRDIRNSNVRPTELHVDGIERHCIQYSPEVCIGIDALRCGGDIVPVSVALSAKPTHMLCET